jgi:drug/metabolite transporter (DMT)-like permease
LAFLSLVCTLAGYWLWFAVIRDAPISTVALTIFVQPIAGVAIAALTLHESLRPGQFWGGLVISAGLLIGFSRQIRLKSLPQCSRVQE